MLFSDYNPGGKLPITFPEAIEQLPPYEWDYKNDYVRGIGYRYYDKQNIEPLFPFGYGLSYTKFEYSELKINPKLTTNSKVNIIVNVKNIGDREGDEVVQLYLQDMESSIERPIKELKRFKRITLKPGENKKVEFNLVPEDLSFSGLSLLTVALVHFNVKTSGYANFYSELLNPSALSCRGAVSF